jgi:carbamoyltransferase
MKLLGIWDGHDSGAALIDGDEILFAANEERFTRRKLEIVFPEKSIEACLKYTHTRPEDIAHIAVSTADVAKTLSRIFPFLKEEYYQIRRRKKGPFPTSTLKKKMKYRLTEYPPLSATRWINRFWISRHLKKIGFDCFTLHLVDHHFCHAAAAAFCSGFDKGIAVTLDGLGDGRSGSVYRFDQDGLSPVASFPARHSLGIFFEHVTNLMNMRELEDEGKVMALANYAYPIDDDKNPMMALIRVDGLSIYCKYASLPMYDALGRIFWRYPPEQFAYMAQRTLEVKVLELIQNIAGACGLDRFCLAGGVFSNVKVNRLIRNLPEVADCYVFPHMGDGGLAVGAALAANCGVNHAGRMLLPHLFLGPGYGDDEIEKALKDSGLLYGLSDHIKEETADLIAAGKIVFWFQGKMELGPRALGARSILARPDSDEIKDLLNLKLKKRVWYQPFCPAMLAEEAQEILEDYDGRPNPFMTMAYVVKPEKRKLVRGVINVDGSCRPQIIGKEKSPFADLLHEVRKRTGHGIVLNTSFNLHGEPLVCSPTDAVKTMIETGNADMAIGNFLVRQK